MSDASYVQTQTKSNSLPQPVTLIIKKYGELLAAFIAGLLILTGWGLDQFSGSTHWYVYLMAYIIGGFAKAKEGMEDTIKDRDLNVELLMILAAVGAAIIGHWFEGAVLIFIFALSGALESFSMEKSSKALSSLMELQPETARRISADGKEDIVAVGALKIGDLIRIKPGERIPADGKIRTGQTSVDESAMTGESMPVLKKESDEILAGTVNIDGSLQIDVTKKSNETTFSKILHLVQEAQNEKVPSQVFIERFEGPYVKTVLAVVALMLLLPPLILGWAWDTTFYKAMVLLVVASPCALVASTMPAVLSAIAYGARQGILVKGGLYLENLANIDAIAFDKTGTLTIGTPSVVNFANQSEWTDEVFLNIVAAVENETSHPLAKAIVEYAEEKKSQMTNMTISNVQTMPGYGVIGTVNGKTIKIGKGDWLGEDKVAVFNNSLSNEQTVPAEATLVYVEYQEQIIGYLALKDQLRKTTRHAIDNLNKYGIKTIMLTGDQQLTAEAIGLEAGVTNVIANCLPEHKADQVKKLKEKHTTVAMIGDGINDTPALAHASIGIAMGEGTDAALETADVVLVKNDLMKVSEAIRLSKKMNRIIKQNIIFALGMIIFLIFTNFSANLPLPLGVLGHEGSTILVILNGLRLLKG